MEPPVLLHTSIIHPPSQGTEVVLVAVTEALAVLAALRLVTAAVMVVQEERQRLVIRLAQEVGQVAILVMAELVHREVVLAVMGLVAVAVVVVVTAMALMWDQVVVAQVC